jgi:hypothetical protein
MRGSRPGERRGGRQKGTPNKKTAYVRAVMAAHAAQDNVSPLDLILAVVREPHVALGQRVKMALKALPHMHAKAKAGQLDELSDDRAKPDNGSSSAANVNANARTATINQELMPLDFLQSVIRDAKTPAALQIKVAQAIIPYIRPKRSVRPKRPAVVADRYGFAVDRELARKLRNKLTRISALKPRRNAADQELIARLSVELRQMTAALQCPCPSRYSMQDFERDRQQLDRLLRKRRSRRGLNAIEDATLAHINARYMAFVSGPEMQGRARLAELKEKERKFRVAFGRPLTYREQALLSYLSTLYPQKKVEISPEFLAEWSAFSAEEVDCDDDRYSLEHQRASANAVPEPAPPAETTPSEAVDTEDEWVSAMSLARLGREQRQRQVELSRESARMKRVIASQP